MADNVEITLRPIEVKPESAPSIDYDKLSVNQKLIANKILDEAERQGIDPDLMLSIAHIENKFNTGASPKGALGPMQLMPGTAKDLNVDPNDLDQNIAGGVTYFKTMLDKYKDPHVAAIAYNAGPGVADKFLETDDTNVIPKETKKYIEQLDSLYKPKAPDDIDVEDVPIIDAMPEEAPANTGDDPINKGIAGATTGAIAGLANAGTRQKMIDLEAEQSTPKERARAKLRSENVDIALKEKGKTNTGRLTNQQSLVQDAEKRMLSSDKVFTKAQERLTAAEELAKKLGIVEEVVQTTPGGVTQKGGLGSGAMKHSNTMGEVHEANVVRKGTEATGSGWKQKSRLIVPEKYASTSSLNTDQLLAQKKLMNAQREYNQAQKDLSVAKSTHAKESGKLVNLSKETEQGVSRAQGNLNIAKKQYENVASKRAPSMLTRAGQQVGKSIFGSVVPGAMAGVDLEDARQRYARGDIPGAIISGIGGVGGAMSMVPPIPPIGTAARLVGGLTSLVAPAVNYYRDTKAEEAQQEPPAQNYAFGGAVKKFSVGGLGKIAKQAATKLSEALGKHEAKTVAITQADRQKVGGGYLGGPGFSGLQHTDPAYGDVGAVWAVKGPTVAKTLINSAKRQPEGQTIFIPMIGSPTQHKSGQMVFDNIINDFRKSARQGNLDPELLDIMNLRLINTVDKEGKPLFSQNFNIASRKSNNEMNTFDKRAAVADVIAGIGVGGKKSQIIDYDKLIARTTDPDLIGVPTGSLGSRMFTLSGEMLERPDLHPAFPTILTGEDLGVQFAPAPREIVLNDFIKNFTEAKGREPGNMDYTRGYAPSNMITEEMLTNLQKAGYAEGGEVKGYAKGGSKDVTDKPVEYLRAPPSDSFHDLLGTSGKVVGGLQRFLNEVPIPNPFKLLSGDIDTIDMGGDLLLGGTADMLDRWSKGRAPITFPAYGSNGSKLVSAKFDPAIIDALSVVAPGVAPLIRATPKLASGAVSGINRANRALRTPDPLLMNVETSTANRSDDVAETMRRFKEANARVKYGRGESMSHDYPMGQGVWTGEEGAAQFHPNVMANVNDFTPEETNHMLELLNQYGIGAGRFRPDLIQQPSRANALQVSDADPEWIKSIGQHYAQNDLPAVVFAQPNNKAMIFSTEGDMPNDLSMLLNAPQLTGKKLSYGKSNIPTDRNYIYDTESARVTGTKKSPKKKAK